MEGNANWVSGEARIGKNIEMGFGVRIYGNVEIGDDCRIDDHCVIGYPSVQKDSPPLRLGNKAFVRSHTVLYEGATIGPYLETGHHVVIREGAIIGDNLRVGNFSDIEGACEIGDFCRFHSYAHIGRGSKIGNFVWIFSLVTLTNDPLPPSKLAVPVTIDDGAVICVAATVMPGTVLGKGAFVASGSLASGTISPGAVVAGQRGETAGTVRHLMHFESGLRHPWFDHFKEVYPERAHARIEALSAEVKAALSVSKSS
jgi:UDP-3-O-[3-hydroxymyristoyl] glucosamine N-acyltransferase